MSDPGAGPANTPMPQWDTGVQPGRVAGLTLFAQRDSELSGDEGAPNSSQRVVCWKVS
jgi:hypothetical protein